MLLEGLAVFQGCVAVLAALGLMVPGGGRPPPPPPDSDEGSWFFRGGRWHYTVSLLIPPSRDGSIRCETSSDMGV
jgi:hypothetical protein